MTSFHAASVIVSDQGVRYGLLHERAHRSKTKIRLIFLKLGIIAPDVFDFAMARDQPGVIK
jgi:hypothetical protein